MFQLTDYPDLILSGSCPLRLGFPSGTWGAEVDRRGLKGAKDWVRAARRVVLGCRTNLSPLRRAGASRCCSEQHPVHLERSTRRALSPKHNAVFAQI